MVVRGEHPEAAALPGREIGNEDERRSAHTRGGRARSTAARAGGARARPERREGPALRAERPSLSGSMQAMSNASLPRPRRPLFLRPSSRRPRPCAAGSTPASGSRCSSRRAARPATKRSPASSARSRRRFLAERWSARHGNALRPNTVGELRGRRALAIVESGEELGAEGARTLRASLEDPAGARCAVVALAADEAGAVLPALGPGIEVVVLRDARRGTSPAPVHTLRAVGAAFLAIASIALRRHRRRAASLGPARAAGRSTPPRPSRWRRRARRPRRPVARTAPAATPGCTSRARPDADGASRARPASRRCSSAPRGTHAGTASRTGPDRSARAGPAGARRRLRHRKRSRSGRRPRRPRRAPRRRPTAGSS